MQAPPHALPQRLDALGVLAEQQRFQVAGDQGMHGGAAGADRVAVADALGAGAVPQPHRDELEVADVAVGAVGQHLGQRDPVVVGLEDSDRHGGSAAEGDPPLTHAGAAD